MLRGTAGEEKGVGSARGGEPERGAEDKECRGGEGAAALAERGVELEQTNKLIYLLSVNTTCHILFLAFHIVIESLASTRENHPPIPSD